MKPLSKSNEKSRASQLLKRGFTLIELLVVIAIIAILSSLLLPALSKGQSKAKGIVCLNNTKQLVFAWQMYYGDHEDSLPYNLGMQGSSFRTNANWVNNVMTWATDSDNTNLATITGSSLGAYTSGNTAIYRCPSDVALSSVQTDSGWKNRIRSYSMNAMIGNAGDISSTGVNTNNPYFVQFFKASQIPKASEIFVFLDEHPDSIDDGYFINQASYYPKWHDLPASYHGNSASFAYGDGHCGLHRWTLPLTTISPLPNTTHLPISVSSTERADFDWVVQHMSILNY